MSGSTGSWVLGRAKWKLETSGTSYGFGSKRKTPSRTTDGWVYFFPLPNPFFFWVPGIFDPARHIFGPIFVGQLRCLSSSLSRLFQEVPENLCLSWKISMTVAGFLMCTKKTLGFKYPTIHSKKRQKKHVVFFASFLWLLKT